MKINELAKKTGLTAPTIRFYEQEGLLDTRHVQRGENNYRDYCEEAVEHLLMIKEVQAAGFTLAEFKELDEACNAADGLVTQKAATFIRRKIAAVGEKIAELERVQTYLTSKLAEMLQEENASLGADSVGFHDADCDVRVLQESRTNYEEPDRFCTS